MKYLFAFLLFCLFLFLISAPAAAQWGGVIGVYADVTAYCGMPDTPGPRTFYVMHRFTVGTTGSRFRIEFSPGFTGTVVSVNAPAGEIVGDLASGVSVTYGGECLAGTIVVLELGMLMYGTSPECSWVRAAAHPLSEDGKIESYDCSGIRLPADWQGTHISDELGIFCPDLYGPVHLPPGCNPTDEPLGTEHRTWSAVKALYR